MLVGSDGVAMERNAAVWRCLKVFLEFRQAVSPHGSDGAAFNEVVFVAVVTGYMEISSQLLVEPYIINHLQKLLVLVAMFFQVSEEFLAFKIVELVEGPADHVGQAHSAKEELLLAEALQHALILLVVHSIIEDCDFSPLDDV